MEQELAELNKTNVGRRALLTKMGMGAVVTAGKKVGEVFTKLKEDLKNPQEALKALRHRSIDSAKKLSALGIKAVDQLDKFGPKTKLIVGLGAAGISIFTGTALATGAWQAVSSATLSRRSYQKQMQKALEGFAYDQFVESKRDYHENTIEPARRNQAQAAGRDYVPQNLADWVAVNLDDDRDPRYTAFIQKMIKEKEAFIQNIKMSDFEADSSYKDKRYRAIELSLATGLALGVFMPSAIKEFINSEAFDFIKDKVGEYTPAAILETIDKAKSNLSGNFDRVMEMISPNGASAPTQPVVATPQAPAPVSQTPATSASANAQAPAPVASSTAPVQATTPTTPINAGATNPSTINTPYTVNNNDRLEKIFENNFEWKQSGFTAEAFRNAFYNFFDTDAGKQWMADNSISNIDEIKPNMELDLSEAVKLMGKASITDDGESLLERAKRLFPSS